MSDDKRLQLTLRRQALVTEDGYTRWQVATDVRSILARQTALLLCDVWDNHWCRGANERLAVMLPRMSAVVTAARSQGVHIIHAPSDTMAFYTGTPARLRAQAVPLVEPPPARELPDPHVPIDDSDGGSDTGEKSWHTAWSRQHPAITIDEERDIISADGREVYSYLRQQNIEQFLIMGVHTNMCILHRSFAIKQMVRWGMEVALIRDLTDTMYNPALSPFVAHEEGTRLVVEFIEKLWCPTLLSSDLVPA
jgi:nicotinamidase-related amidase